jgi:protein TonB
MNKLNLTRLIIFGSVALIHAALLMFMVVRMATTIADPEAPLTVMKLTDVREAPPPPPLERPRIRQTSERVAEKMIETEKTPPPEEIPQPEDTRQSYLPAETENYLPMHKISQLPSFSEADILKALVYPPIAQRSGLEGMVYLEIFIDSYGQVQRVDILKENPENYGFGEAAAKAFRGRTCVPARSNGAAVAVRYRYPVRFKLKA